MKTPSFRENILQIKTYVPGKPIVYRTTSVFLRSFGLSSVADLPPLAGQAETVITDEQMDIDDITDSENAEEN